MIGPADQVEIRFDARKYSGVLNSFEVPMIGESGTEMTWRTARDCDGGQCVEIGIQDNVVMVRDSADRDGGRIALDDQQWRRFVAALKNGL